MGEHTVFLLSETLEDRLWVHRLRQRGQVVGE